MFGNKDSKDLGKDYNEPQGFQDTYTPPAPAAVETRKAQSVIGEDVTFDGVLKVEGNIVVHGKIEGEIHCTGHLMIGKNGRVKANLDVGSASIAGNVEGKIVAKERVELQTASHLKGDVHAKSFVIADGCFFQGNCTMGSAPATNLRAVPESDHGAADLKAA